MFEVFRGFNVANGSLDDKYLRYLWDSDIEKNNS